MVSFSKVALVGLALGLGLFLVGCANTTSPSNITSSMADMPAMQGVMCSKCKTTWINVAKTGDKGRIVAYTDEKTHMCPDCMDAVTSFFNTGKLEHNCKTCGPDTMSICGSHDH